jgi:hypothetical protein
MPRFPRGLLFDGKTILDGPGSPPPVEGTSPWFFYLDEAKVGIILPPSPPDREEIRRPLWLRMEVRMPNEDDDIPVIYLFYVVAGLAVIAIIALGLCFMLLPGPT